MMCGVTGIWKFEAKPVLFEDVQSMAATLRHRGPDGAGYAILSNHRLGLGHTRLSIIDPQLGAQPIWSADGSVCAVVNGEIYDYKAHRAQLQQLGHAFHSNSDSEVLIALYQRHGLDFLTQLNGEFAFLLWDSRERRLIAARDRMGVKPLYYHATAKEVLFASEAKAILTLQRVERRVSPAYLTGPFLGAFPPHFSPFSGIEEIPPGHFAVLTEDDQEMSPPRAYWEAVYDAEDLSLDEAAERVRYELSEAVRRRLVADVPVCTYLSGGIDSTLVCALTAEHASNVKSFNIGFGGSEFDEAREAREIAKHFGVEFESLPCSMSMMAAELERTVLHTERALANPNSTAKLILSRFISQQGYRVALTGEGADEVFAGYPYFKLEKLWRMQLSGETALANELWKQFCEIERRSEGMLWDRSDAWRSAIPVLGFPSMVTSRAVQNARYIPKIMRTKELGIGPGDRPDRMLARSFERGSLNAIDPIHASLTLTRAQLNGYIIPALGDRVEMANSIEGRTPFLDSNVVALSMRLSSDHLVDIKRLREKAVLHRAFKDILPARVRQQHKHPFLTSDWWSMRQTRVGRELFDHYLSTDSIQSAGMFRPRFVRLALLAWQFAPRRSNFHRRLDVLLGAILTLQIMHAQLVAARPTGGTLLMIDRSRPS